MWRVKKDGTATLVSVLPLHSGPVTALALLLLQDSTLELATTSNDSTMCLTRIALDGKEESSELKDPHWRQDMGGGVAIALHLTRCCFKSHLHVLKSCLTGFPTRKIPYYSLPKMIVVSFFCKQDLRCLSSIFQKVSNRISLKKTMQVGKLVGHEDWVTCLASRQETDDGLLIATGSQDSFVRLWRVERRREEVDKKKKEEELAVTEQVVKLGHEEWLVVVESVLAGGVDDHGDD